LGIDAISAFRSFCQIEKSIKIKWPICKNKSDRRHQIYSCI